uniref:Uncharacterized protein n=1 Tax=Oryza sativa subsp. japonica TaxID=39947 RepID=Q6Z4U7_ORYSJ|nr:hypothetical protein [Oryza sativa Japonica Group]
MREMVDLESSEAIGREGATGGDVWEVASLPATRRHGEAASHPTAPVERSTSRPYPRVPPWEGGVHPATAAVRRDRLLAQTLTPSPPPSPAAAWLDAEREWGKREENGGRGGGERDGEWSSGGDRPVKVGKTL